MPPLFYWGWAMGPMRELTVEGPRIVALAQEIQDMAEARGIPVMDLWGACLMLAWHLAAGNTGTQDQDRNLMVMRDIGSRLNLWASEGRVQ